MRKLFGISIGLLGNHSVWGLKLKQNAETNAPEAKSTAIINDIKQRMSLVLNDCTGFDTERVQYRIRTAPHAADLWIARSDIYQIIAIQYGQAEAARRINSLTSRFKGLLPARQLTPI